MKIGMNLPVMVPGLGRDALLEWARRIDAGPFSHLACGERITFPNPELLVTLSAAAVLTERVEIFANVIVLPMHDAVWAAKRLATLDVLSGGRLVVGVGAGAREEDFRAVGAAFGERRIGQMGEQVERMRRVWRGENVVPDALRPVEPLPLQAGGPPVLAGSIGERAIRRVAAWADGLCGFSFGPSLPEIERGFAVAREAWRDAGREMPPRLGTGFWLALGGRSREQLDRYLERYLGFMGPAVATQLAKLVSVDSPARLRETLRALEDAGADEVSLVPTTLDPDEIDRVADLLG